MKYLFQLGTFMTLLVLASCGDDNKNATTTTATTDSTAVKTTNDRVFGVARIEPEDGITDLIAGTSGKIQAVLMDENMIIQKGQTLLVIDQSVENSQLLQAKSKIMPQKAAVSVQKANAETIRIRLKNAREVVNRNQELYTGNAGTKQALDDSRYVAEQLEKELAAAETLVAQANSRISELETDIKYF